MFRTEEGRRGTRARRMLRGGALAVALGLLALPGSSAYGSESATNAVRPGTQGSGPLTTCFWGAPSENVGPIDQLNEAVYKGLAPDTNVVYYYTRFELPVGATVTLHGQFPHSRFFSLTSYKTVGEETGLPATALTDYQIAPDPGSVNPYIEGEARNGKHRSFTVTVSGQVAPAEPAPNTLYVGREGHTEETQQVEIIERIYRADKNYEANGGVPLPAPTYNPAVGSPVSEEAAACSALSDVSGASSVPTTHIGVPSSVYVKLRSELPGTTSPEHPAVDPLRWERFLNSQYLTAPFYRGTALESNIEKLPTEPRAGYYSTPANAYLVGYASRDFGPNPEGHNILVLHAKMPTHPSTYQHEPVNNGAGTQVRYWSVCALNALLAKPGLGEANSACLFDEEVPTNVHGEYTIVMSTPEDRPKNAKPACGVAWMGWGEGDGYGRPDLDTLIMRNQLSNPTFEQSIEKVKAPGEEEAVMGAYYPHGTYMTKQQFEERLCWSANA